MNRVAAAVMALTLVGCKDDGGSAGSTSTGEASTSSSSSSSSSGSSTGEPCMPPEDVMPGCAGLVDAQVAGMIEGDPAQVCLERPLGTRVLDANDEVSICVDQAGILGFAKAEVTQSPLGEMKAARYIGFYTYWDPATPNPFSDCEPKYILIEIDRFPGGWGTGCVSSQGSAEHFGSAFVDGGAVPAGGTLICSTDDAGWAEGNDVTAVSLLLSNGDVCEVTVTQVP